MKIESVVSRGLRAEDAAAYLGIKSSFLWALAKSGELLPVRLAPKLTIWTRESLDAYIDRKAGSLPVPSDVSPGSANPPYSVYHPDLQCGLGRMEINFVLNRVAMYLPDDECADMGGAIRVALAVCPGCETVATYSGGRISMLYIRDGEEWRCDTGR